MEDFLATDYSEVFANAHIQFDKLTQIEYIKAILHHVHILLYIIRSFWFCIVNFITRNYNEQCLYYNTRTASKNDCITY